MHIIGGECEVAGVWWCCCCCCCCLHKNSLRTGQDQSPEDPLTKKKKKKEKKESVEEVTLSLCLLSSVDTVLLLSQK